MSNGAAGSYLLQFMGVTAWVKAPGRARRFSHVSLVQHIACVVAEYSSCKALWDGFLTFDDKTV